jgi:hypothetical protein
VATETPACAATSLMLTGTFTRFSTGLTDSLKRDIGTCQTWHTLEHLASAQ